MIEGWTAQVISGVSAAMAAQAGPHVPGAPGLGPVWAGVIPALPLLGVVLCTLCAIFRVKSKLPAVLSVACLAASFAATVALYLKLDGAGPVVSKVFEWINFKWGTGRGGTQEFVANFAFYIDGLTLLWMLFVTGLATLIALYASEYMAHDVGAGYCRFFAAFNLFVFSMSCLVMADNLVLLYLGWEGVGLCSYLLIGYFYKKPSAVAAAKKAFIVNRIGDLGLAMGIWLTFTKFGTVEYARIFADPNFGLYLRAATEGNFAAIPWSVQAIALLLMVGAFGKSAQFPLYVWLPDAMEGPTPVSALIHAATMVTAGVFLIARAFLLFQVSELALPIVAGIGAFTALLAATIGMAQFDIKRIMAYSTVSQLGYMFAGLGVVTSVGAAFHVFTHAFFKALLFLACGAVMHGFAGQLDLRKLSGVQKMPGWRIVGFTMLIGCLNLAGFPFMAGFWSKDTIIAQAFTTPGYGLVGWVLLLTAGLTAYYTFRVYFRVFLGPVEYHAGEDHHADHTTHEELAGHTSGHEPVHAGHTPEPHHEQVAEERALAEQEHIEGGSHGFHPHAPGWAINFVLATLAVLAMLAIGVNFIGPHRGEGGWVAGMIERSSAAWPAPGAHHASLGGAAEGAAGVHAAAEAVAHGEPAAHGAGTVLGMNPHAVMYYVSALVGLVGIVVAWWLHLAGRTTAATARADKLLPALGPIPRWAQHKWYVDELYDYLFRLPLLTLSHIFALIDKLLVDGLVNVFGWLPRALGKSLRPSQSGELHGYAAAMAGGIGFILLIVLVVTM